MKMHNTIPAALLALVAILAPCSGAPPTLLEQRAKLEGAKLEAEAAAAADPADTQLADVAADKARALANFDSEQATKFGPGWLNRWRNSDYDNPDDEAVDIYLNDGPLDIELPTISGTKKKELLGNLATKPVLVSEDLETVMLFRQHEPGLADRIEEFAALLPSNGIRNTDYFVLKHLALAGRPGRKIVEAWAPHMSLQDWFDLASADAPLPADAYAAMRDHLLAHSVKLLVDKRQAAGQAVEGPEFDAAVAPVVTALDAPKFAGLSAAVTSLGIDLTIPEPDYVAQEAVAVAVEDAAESRTMFTTAWGEQMAYQHGLGSVMFVKGREAYTAWRDILLTNP